MKNILFITGTRADFGKLKSLIQAVKDHPDFDYSIFCTGMHLLQKYGKTVIEIDKAGFEHVFPYFNQEEGDSMDQIMANTIQGVGRYIGENKIDLIVVHGDRVETLAGACSGALRNILVAHVEGGEVSGTVDELIRHATSKMAHIHFVSNEIAKRRLLQLGELEVSVFNIGSPDIDVMLSDELPTTAFVKERYGITFENYAIGILHPVTTDLANLDENCELFVDAILNSNQNYVMIYPNNDMGSNTILDIYKKMENHPNIKLFPSIRFEFFLSLLKDALFIIGNSSAGIHEAPIYGVPTINIGSRQNNRMNYESIVNVAFDANDIIDAIKYVVGIGRFTPTDHYGSGNSAKLFIEQLESDRFWSISSQKFFRDRHNFTDS